MSENNEKLYEELTEEISAAEEIILDSDAENEADSGEQGRAEEKQPQTLADLFPENRWLAAVYKVLLGVFLLAFLIGFVWLCDTVIAWVMSLLAK